MMELLQELLLMASLSLVLAFLIAKFVSAASSDSDPLNRSYAAAADVESVLGDELDVGGDSGEVLEVGGFGKVEGDRVGREGIVVGSEMAGESFEEDKRLEASEGMFGADMVEEVVDKDGIRNIDLELVGVVEGQAKGRTVEVDVVQLPEEGEVEEESQRSKHGKFDVELGEREERLDSGSGAAIEDSKVLPSPEDEETTREIRLESETVAGKSKAEEEDIAFLYEDDDWEGVERSEAGSLFGAAMSFVNSTRGSEALSRLSSDLQLQLYGFHKVATEGPCYETQPMALKVSARAKWHAWQKLGNMNPEVAMEQYIALLSDTVPDWMMENLGGEGISKGGSDSSEAGVSEFGTPVTSSLQQNQPFLEIERNEPKSS